MNRIQMPLDVPVGYSGLDPLVKNEICNGAGARGGIKVPDTMWGLDCREAFDIHDYDYWRGEHERHKRSADKRMQFNMTTIIVNKGGFLMWPRMIRATTYFMAVVWRGKKAFWAGKNSHGV